MLDQSSAKQVTNTFVDVYSDDCRLHVQPIAELQTSFSTELWKDYDALHITNTCTFCSNYFLLMKCVGSP